MSRGIEQLSATDVPNSSPELSSHGFSGFSRSSNFEESPAQSDSERPSRTTAQDVPLRRISTLRRRRDRSRRHKSPRVWKKILWVKQSYPDNYTDPPTFLSHLQWNPRVVPYDFWPLVADSTVIVQHVCSVIIFISCFIGIYQERISPISVVGWGSTCAFVCWLFWDAWIGAEEITRSVSRYKQHQQLKDSRRGMVEDTMPNALGLTVPRPDGSRYASRSTSPNPSTVSLATSYTGPLSYQFAPTSNYDYIQPYNAPGSYIPARWHRRFATAKSAVLIYCALLGLSPILKSLTKSTTSDSIWAMSSWLLLINVFFYDYGGDGTDNSSSDIAGAKYQSSLSTNAALMASTVLASRLTSTTHVFSLTLFSIEVFGLFPVFRRQLRQQSWQLHLVLTILLIFAAGAGIGIVLTDHNKDTHLPSLFPNWKAALTGAILWGLGCTLAMGTCSWWLISLQKYKNVVIGPWDPAKPIVRGGTGMDMNGYG